MQKRPHASPVAKHPEQRQPDAEDGFSLSGHEEGEVEEKRPPRAAVLHEIIRREGEQELNRGAVALGLSALAAGLSMGFSLLARGLLHRYMPEGSARYLIENLGYSFGFIVVILARQQLFTENTMTAVLPLMTDPSLGRFMALLRMWAIVLAGNLLGVAVFAWGILHLQQFDDLTQAAFVRFGRELMLNSPWQMFSKGILAGWLVATMVWLLPAADSSKILVIVLTTYLIALGGFTHIIVGSLETLYLVFSGDLSLADYALRFALPTLAGNIVGGSLIFALISHAQVRSDGA